MADGAHFERLNVRMDRNPVDPPEVDRLDPEILRVVEAQIAARNKAAYDALSLHGVVGTLDIFNQARNLAGNTDIISYRVPSGQLAIVSEIAVVCNNPAISMGNLYVWRILVNGQELPNISTSLIFGNTGYRTNVGNPHRPMKLTPFVVQSDQLITIEIRPSANIVGAYVVFIARLVGRLVNPGVMNVFPGGNS